MNRNGVERVMIVITGPIAGAFVGSAIGAAVRSDNLPFFVLLGAAIGLCLSGVACFVTVRH